MKKFLENLIARKQKEIDEMLKRSEASEDINEVRSIGQQIRKAQEEIEEARTQLAACSAGLDNARAEAEEGEDAENEGSEDEEEGEQPTNQRSRNFRPGVETRSFDLRGGQNRAVMEKRANNFVKSGRISVDAEETRATLVSSGDIATPTGVSGINDSFDRVSSIVDMVKVENCVGMGGNKVAYEKNVATAANKAEGAAAAESGPAFDFVEITPTTVAVLSKVSKEVRRQSPLNYTAKVQKSALTALRKKAAAMITDKIKASALNASVELAAIDEKTLRQVTLMYGGDETVEGGAVLFLNKNDLIAFGDVRGTNEKKAVYEITPDGNNPNTGTIKDGGLTVRYCINSNCAALSASGTAAAAATMFYGAPTACELDLFSPYEITLLEERFADQGMLGINGDVQLGADVVVDKGFVVVKKKAAA